MRYNKYPERHRHFIIFDIIFILAISLFFVVKKPITFVLIGDTEVTIVVGEEYNDLLFKALRGQKEVELKGITYEVISDLDITKLGTYNYKYEIKYHNKIYYLERNIKVLDNVKPEIIVNEDVLKNSFCKSYLLDNEVQAIDNYDGDITNNVTKEITSDGIYYRVIDSSNNVTEVFKNISYKDEEKPKLSLKGDSTIYLLKGEKYQEPGYTTSDNCDEDLDSSVIIDNKVKNDVVGTYEIKYTISDSSGNKTSKVRKVIVYDANSKIDEIENYIKKNKYNISIIYYDINSKYKYSYRENTEYFGASLIKTLAALYAYDKMSLTSDIKKLVKLAITISDNNAYTKLVNKIGVNTLKQYGASLGLSYVSRLRTDNIFITTTASEQLILWQNLWNFINRNKNGQELKSYFINDTARYLDFSGSPEIMHKYGYANGYFHDVGIVLDKNPYIIIILTKEGNGKYKTIINNISKKIYEFHQIKTSSD